MSLSAELRELIRAERDRKARATVLPSDCCPWCLGELPETRNSQHIYCSPVCSAAAYRDRKYMARREARTA